MTSSTPLPEQGTDTNQASEDELEKLINERVKIASTETKSGDDVVHIAWLADGIDLWNRSNGKFGHSPAKARRYIISSVTRLIRTEKLKLLAEVREAHREGYMRGVSDFSGYFMDASNAAQRNPIMPEIAIELREEYRAPILLTQLEAEL